MSVDQGAAAPAPTPPADPAPVEVVPGGVYAQTIHDEYTSPPSDRARVVLVVRGGDDGTAQVIPLGWAETLTGADVAELRPLDEL